MVNIKWALIFLLALRSTLGYAQDYQFEVGLALENPNLDERQFELLKQRVIEQVDQSCHHSKSCWVDQKRQRILWQNGFEISLPLQKTQLGYSLVTGQYPVSQWSTFSPILVSLIESIFKANQDLFKSTQSLFSSKAEPQLIWKKQYVELAWENTLEPSLTEWKTTEVALKWVSRSTHLQKHKNWVKRVWQTYSQKHANQIILLLAQNGRGLGIIDQEILDYWTRLSRDQKNPQKKGILSAQHREFLWTLKRTLLTQPRIVDYPNWISLYNQDLLLDFDQFKSEFEFVMNEYFWDSTRATQFKTKVFAVLSNSKLNLNTKKNLIAELVNKPLVLREPASETLPGDESL